MQIVTRSEWGFDGWSSAPYSVDERTRRTEFYVHYEGGNAVLSQTGPSVPRGIHAYHKSRGWKGIGYGHVIDANGAIYEGRGFNLVGSHCPDHNTSAYSVQIHLGGNETPTAAQLSSARALYNEACRRSGRDLAKRGHRDGYATECPGDKLYQWVRDGMPVRAGSGGGVTSGGVTGGASSGTTFQQEDIMGALANMDEADKEVFRSLVKEAVVSQAGALGIRAAEESWVKFRTADLRSPIGLLRDAAGGIDYTRLASELAPLLGSVTPAELDASLRRLFSSIGN